MDLNKVYNMDCMIGMKKLLKENGEGCIDLIITSPPYNLGGGFHTGNKRMKSYDVFHDDMPENEYQSQQIEFLNLCFRLLKKGGSMFYNHKPRIKNKLTIHPLEWVMKSEFELKQEIVWQNGSQNFDKIRFYPMTERIYWLVKDKDTTIYNELGVSDVWRFKNSARHEIHKATFPIELPLTIIQSIKDAKVILDPYMGIGTTAVASIELRRSFIGFELSQDYIDIAEEYIEREKSQTNIFDFI